MLNYNFTETTRKRKYDVCNALGPQFRPYATADDTGEYLFGLETQKMMKSELKKIPAKSKKTDNFTSSKNFHASGKAPRSSSGPFRHYNNNNNNSNNNNNYVNRSHGSHNNNGNNNNRGNYNNNHRNQSTRSRGRGKRW